MLQWATDRWKFRRAARAAVLAATRQYAAPAPPSDTQDIVLVPCWRRPEMLWHCIDNICKAEGIEAMHVVFRPDSGFDPDNLAVIREHAKRLPSHEVQPAPRCPYRRTKLSANILLGYLNAAARAARYVYMVEEDIMVGRDFFRWHAAVHAQRANLFCSIAVRNHNRNVRTPDDPDAYYLTSGDYCSWGVCFDAAVIRECVVPHVNLAYLSRPKRYLRDHFADSRVSLGFVEQASLLRRIQEVGSLPIAYPATPRAFHAGFYGRNRPGKIQGALHDRVRRLDGMIYDCTAMRSAALSDRYADDSEPVPLDIVCGQGLHQLDLPSA
jgi:hypothetical protein